MFQISRAYSLIVLSEENQPTLAILRIAAARQPARSCQRRSTSRWAAVIGVEIGRDHEPVMVIEAAHQFVVAGGSSGENTPEAIASTAWRSSREASMVARGL